MDLRDREQGWLDDVWAEGGAVVDHVARRVVFYSSEVVDDPSVKRAFMRMLPLLWPGWTFVWAYDGIGDMAAEVGVDRAVVRCIDEDDLAMPEQDEYSPFHLLTVRDESGALTAFHFPWDRHTAWQGPALLDRLPSGGDSRMDLEHIPVSGLHVNVPERTAGMWLHDWSSGLVPAFPDLWPGWHTEFWQDEHEQHLSRCENAITCPSTDLSQGLDRVLKLVPARFRQTEDPIPEEWSKVFRAAESLRGLLG